MSFYYYFIPSTVLLSVIFLKKFQQTSLYQLAIFAKNYSIHSMKNYIYKPKTLSKGWIKTFFYHNDNFYEIPIKLPKGPNCVEIKKILNENDSDVTTEILQLMGPNLDFYTLSITPNILGHKILIFITEKDDFTFREKDVIKFD